MYTDLLSSDLIHFKRLKNAQHIKYILVVFICADSKTVHV